MFTPILNIYNPKDYRSHAILKYFSEGLSENENILFVEEILKRGSWLLPTEISRISNSSELKHKTETYFYQIFDKWVSNRIQYSNSISPRTKNPYITIDLHFEFREALLSIKNLGFTSDALYILEKLVLNSNPIYLEKFLNSAFWVIIEEYEEKDIELFLNYFFNIYISQRYANLNDFLYNSLNKLAFSHKIYYLSNEFLSLLNELSKAIEETQDTSNYKQLISILLIDLIRNKKLELADSKYEPLIKATLNSLEKGNYDNLDFLLFLKRFKYSFTEFNVTLESEELFGKMNDWLININKRNNEEKRSLLHHLLNSSNQYFELLLFYQELTTEENAQAYITRFVNLIDKSRIAFSSILWYDEFLNFTPISGEIQFLNGPGFEIKIDDQLFNKKILDNNLQTLINDDFVLHFGFGFLHHMSLTGYPKTKLYFRNFARSKQARIEINPKDREQMEEINKFYISKLNYSASNKKNVLILSPFKESIHKIVTKYELKAFFHSVELYLIETANNYLKIQSPFPKKSNSFKLIVSPININEYKLNLSEENFWRILKDLRPILYQTIYLNHRVMEVAVKKISYAYVNNQTVNGLIKSRSKGGMIVEVFGVEAFLPGSQIDTKVVTDYDSYLGKKMEFKIVKINKEINNFVVSHKAVSSLNQEILKQSFLNNIEVGQVIEGNVKNIVGYGVFVDINGVVGMIHKSDLSWDTTIIPEKFVEMGQKLKVIVLDFDSNKERITLGLKQLSVDPWTKLGSKIKVGDKIKSEVVEVVEFGAFVEIIPGVKGLVHISEMNWNKNLKNAKDLLKKGDVVEAIILSLNIEDKKISLGMKQLINSPKVMLNDSSIFAENSLLIGTIVNLLENGAIIKLTNGPKAFCPKRHLIKSDGSEFKINDVLNIKILECNWRKKRIIVSHVGTYTSVSNIKKGQTIENKRWKQL
jgi:small subunit ribosomal protein S1